MSTESIAPHDAGSAITYPAYVPVEKKVKGKLAKRFEDSVDLASALMNPVGTYWTLAFVLSALALVAFHVAKADIPMFAQVIIGVIWAPVVVVIVGGLALGLTFGPLVAGYFAFRMAQERKNKTEFEPYMVARIADFLSSVGVADARTLVRSSPLHAEAYERIARKVRSIAHGQGMSPEEVDHHGHWYGMLMYPGTAELEREVPLMRILEDRGVTNANEALTALAEPQYRAFAVPVTDEEVAASLEPIKPFSGNIMEVIAIEEKTAKTGYKPTAEERKMMKGTEAYWGGFHQHLALGVFGFTTLLGMTGTFASVILGYNTGSLDLSAAAIWAAVGTYLSIGFGSTMTLLMSASEL